MTFGAKPVKPATKRRRQGPSSSRRTLYMNLGFVAVIVAAILLLVGAAVAIWYGQHLAPVAVVNGTTLTIDDLRDLYSLQLFRIGQTESKVTDEFNAGRLTASDKEAILNQLSQQRQSLTQDSSLLTEQLIDETLQSQLAAGQGLSVIDADIDGKAHDDATTNERRHVWMIEVAPEVSTGADEATDAQKARAQAKASQALSELNGGKKWEDVAKTYSNDTSKANGGDLGWAGKGSNSFDPKFSDAVFAADKDKPTGVILGDDGAYRIGRVTDVTPEQTDPNWQSKMNEAGISNDVYRKFLRLEVFEKKLSDKVTADVIDQATPQRKVSEIYIKARTDGGTGDEVRVSHILFSPGDKPDQSSPLPSNDPAWTKAKQDADAAYEKLKAYVGKPDELEKQFADLAKADSDDGSGANGGDLGYATADKYVKEFSDAIFKAGLKKDDLIAPVKSEFGYHVILFMDRRPDPKGRIDAAANEAKAANADFAAIAKKTSDGAEASKGGDLGWVARLQLSKQLEDAIFATAVPGISATVEVPDDGYYLFKVTEEQTRKPDGTQTTDLRNNAFSNWYQEQKTKATIDRKTSSATG